MTDTLDLTPSGVVPADKPMTATEVLALQNAARDSGIPAQTITPMMMLDKALTSGATPEVLEKLVDLHERFADREAKAEHARAKVHALAEMPPVPMTGRGHNDRPYSTKKDIMDTTRGPLAKYGLALTHDIRVTENHVHVTAILTHENGWDERTTIPLPFDTSGSKSAVQSVGSSQTYGERYTAQAILGLSLGLDVEDDGAAHNPITQQQYEALRAKLEATGADESRFLKHFKVEHLEDLKWSDYGVADGFLDQRAKAMKQQREKAGA